MMVSSQFVTEWLGDTENPEEKSKPDVGSLTTMLFILILLGAIQDVAVDGWAISMLKQKNKGYQSICQSVGHIIGGRIIGKTLLITLEGYGMMTLAQFLLVCGSFFLVITTLIAFFKEEKNTIEAASGSNDANTLKFRFFLRFSNLDKIGCYFFLIQY